VDLRIEVVAAEEARFCDSFHASAMADAGVTGETMVAANEERGVSVADNGREGLPLNSAKADPDLVLLLLWFWLLSSILWCLSSPWSSRGNWFLGWMGIEPENVGVEGL
jgi:hypothetical protein